MYACLNARAIGLTITAVETIALAALAGFEGVDLMVRDVLDANEDPRTLRMRMEDLGLRGGSFPMPVCWRRDAATFERGLASLPRYAEVAAILGLSRTSTWVLPETHERPTTLARQVAHREEVVGMHVKRLGAIARVLEPFGIRIGLEAIGVESSRTGRGLPFVTRLAELDRVLGPLSDVAPNFGIVVDGWHLYAAGESVEAGLAWGVQRVVCIHVADLPAGIECDPAAMDDNDRGLPGENGAIDTRSLLQVMNNAGYQGPIAAEPMSGCRTLMRLEAESAVRHVAAAIRSVWPSPPRG